MYLSEAAHLVEVSQNKLIGEGDFFGFLLQIHKNIDCWISQKQILNSVFIEWDQL